MAVGIRQKFNGGTQANYDAAHAVMEVDTDPPAGMLVHSAGPGRGRLGHHRLLGVTRRVRHVRAGPADAAASSAWRQGIPESARREGVRGPQPPDGVVHRRLGQRVAHPPTDRRRPRAFSLGITARPASGGSVCRRPLGRGCRADSSALIRPALDIKTISRQAGLSAGSEVNRSPERPGRIARSLI